MGKGGDHCPLQVTLGMHLNSTVLKGFPECSSEFIGITEVWDGYLTRAVLPNSNGLPFSSGFS
jgi:hypothetical protein